MIYFSFHFYPTIYKSLVVFRFHEIIKDTITNKNKIKLIIPAPIHNHDKYDKDGLF